MTRPTTAKQIAVIHSIKERSWVNSVQRRQAQGAVLEKAAEQLLEEVTALQELPKVVWPKSIAWKTNRLEIVLRQSLGINSLEVSYRGLRGWKSHRFTNLRKGAEFLNELLSQYEDIESERSGASPVRATPSLPGLREGP